MLNPSIIHATTPSSFICPPPSNAILVFIGDSSAILILIAATAEFFSDHEVNYVELI